MSEASIVLDPWQQLAEVIDSDNPEYLAMFLQLLDPGDTAYTINRLDEERRTKMFSVLSSVRPQFAADLFQHFADEHAADIIEELAPEAAAAIVDEMDSDEQTDVLGEMHEEDAAAILDRMAPEEADDARKRLAYDEDTAGGLMITDFIAVRRDQPVEAVVQQLRELAESNQEYEVRYIYVVDAEDRLAGVMPIRNLVMSPRGTPTTQMMIGSPMTVNVGTKLDEMEDLFDRVSFSAVPVLDDEGKLVGIVQRAAVKEAVGERQGEDLAKFGGIIGGEELRTMPLLSRSARRLAFLLPVMVMTLISASVIALFEPTIGALPILAAFLPVVAGLCGSSGNQSMAVSMRELSLGLVKPADALRVLAKEIGIGVINGLLLGVILGLIIWFVEGHHVLAVLVAIAVPTTTMFAVCVGGAMPLLLKRVHVDPATASGPLVLTIIDFVGFLIVLALAALVLHMEWITLEAAHG